MQTSQIPTRVTVRWASAAGGAYVRPIPATQASPGDGSASFAKGFPPETFQPVASGGVPPFGQDANGIFNQLSAWAQWQAAGGAAQYNSAFSAAVGGYPKFAVLASTTPGRFWQSTVDNNTTDPDGGSATNWTLIVSPFSSIDNNASGYLQYPDGHILNYGFALAGSDGIADVVFKKPFASLILSSGATNETSGRALPAAFAAIGNYTLTGCSIGQVKPGGGAAPGAGARWFVFGR